MVDIEDIDVSSILTKSQIAENMIVANPYVGCEHACIYCYARFMIRFSGHAGQKWGTFVDVKHWKPIKKKNLDGRLINISSVTDAYQPIEKERKRTRELLTELIGTGATIQILTKSSLVLRDLPLLKTHNGKVAIGFSINTLDEGIRKTLDKGSSIKERVHALKECKREGFYTYCFIAPIFPKITDVKEIISSLRDTVNEIWLDSLNYGDAGVRHNVYEWVEKYRPELLELYKENSNKYWKELENDIKHFCNENDIEFGKTNKFTFDSKKLKVISFLE